MLSFLNQLSVRNRIWTIVVLLIGSIVLGSVINILMLREALWDEREIKTRQLVESGFGVLSHLYALQMKGELSEVAAKAAAIGTIKAMRYDEKEYFWLNDLGTPFPKMIMHPTVSSLDGQLLDSETFNCATGLRTGTSGAFTPTDGRMNLFLAFTKVLNQNGAGYVTYTWPKPRAGAAATDERYAKLSYVKKFEPWGWVIGSGVYVDDVDTAVHQQAQRNFLLVAGVGIVLLLFATLMARSITQPLQQTILRMRSIGLGDGGLSQRLPVEGRSEIAELAGGFNEMLGHLEARDAELARHREFLEDEVARRTAALQESEERFSRICATAQDAIIMLDNQGRIAYWNPAAEKMFGHSPDQALGRDLHALLAPERFHEAFKRGFEQFCRSGEGPAVGKTLELIGRRQNGSEFPMELSISAVHMQGNWSAVGFVRDISERKRTEQSTRESRGRIRALLDASDESVLLLDPEGNILAINVFAARRFGQTPDEMAGKNFFDLMPPDLAASRRAAMQHVVVTSEPIHIQDRRGAIFFDNNLYPVIDESGAVESVAVYAKDVTDQHRTKAVEDIFRHLDTVLLKWQMNVESIAQIFCDDILPLFDLPAAWIGRAEMDGRLTLLATAEGGNKGFLDPLRASNLRWDGDAPTCCLPTGAVIRSGHRQMVNFAGRECQSCTAVAHANGTPQAALILP
ncbi:MAG TPA: PAS domain S-box protein, partial [Azonexus sp.]|nr:PAS domain S-box protein [Azonexus sp.]